MNEEEKYTGLEIAIIGLDCKFPKANNADEYWNNLKYGIEGISFFSDEELIHAGIDLDTLHHPNYVKAKGIIEDIEKFDPKFFDYTPGEAMKLDPQIRIFHECVNNALEKAGYQPDTYSGQIGLYAGCTESVNWLLRQIFSGDQPTFNTSYREYLCTSVAYKLGLTGPGMTVLSACSTSLTAVHIACQALLNGECNIAVAGGVNISLPQKRGYYYTEDLIYSPDGHCRTFDASSKGTLVSDGAGVVVLKLLQDAIDDKDQIYAVIKGSAVNNDGNRKAGFSAPSIHGQKEVIETAHHMADIAPESISMLEAHGTATRVGDNIEIEALKRAFKSSKKAYCAIGSVKSNMGHLNEAAGIAGLIKAVLAIQHRQIPKTMHFTRANQTIDFENTPFYVNDTLREWKSDSYPRRAGVSSFGIGGTNVHVVLEEPFLQKREKVQEGTNLLLLSAKTENALHARCQQLKNYMQGQDDVNLSDVAYTLQSGRTAYEYRTHFVVNTPQEYIKLYLAKEYEIRNVKKEEPFSLFVISDLTGNLDVARYSAYLYKNHNLFQKEIDSIVNGLNDNIKHTQNKKWINFLFYYAFITVFLKPDMKAFYILGLGTGELVKKSLEKKISMESVYHALSEETLTARPGQLSTELSDEVTALLKSPLTIVYLFDDETKEGEMFAQLKKYNQKILRFINILNHSEDNRILHSYLGSVWSYGERINQKLLYKDQTNQRMALPAYPYEKKYFFLDDDPMKLGMELFSEKLSSEGPRQLSDYLYQESWKRVMPIKHRGKATALTAIFMDKDLSDIVSWDEKFFKKPITICSNTRIAASKSFDYIMEDSSEEAYLAIFRKIKQNLNVYPESLYYFLLETKKFDDNYIQDMDIEHELDKSFFQLLYLAQAVEQLNLEKPLQLTVIINHVLEVIGDEQIHPIKATIAGMIRSINMECQNIKCKLIDITNHEMDLNDEVFHFIINESSKIIKEDVFSAYRNSYKWIPVYDSIPILEQKEEGKTLQYNGVYLITGGTGGLGMHLADQISKTIHSRIVLFCSSFFPPRDQWNDWLGTHDANDQITGKIRDIIRIEKKGSEVFVYSCDVTDYEALKQTISGIQKSLGMIKGVIHAAGRTGKHLLQNNQKNNIHSVLMPKIKGCLYLNNILKKTDLDFFVVCSSISTIFPIAGQSDYNAANCFLDSYAIYNRKHNNNHIMSIKWDLWENTGMARGERLLGIKAENVKRSMLNTHMNKDGKEIFCLKLSTKRHWFLQDHRTKDFGLLSGTALLEMIRQAMEEINDQNAYRIADIEFLSAVMVPDTEDKELCLMIQKKEEWYEACIYSCLDGDENQWQLNTTAKIRTQINAIPRQDIESLKGSLNQEHKIYSDIDNKNHAGHLTFGKRWLNIKEVFAGEKEGLAYIELDSEYLDDLEEYDLHPGLLDSATSFLLEHIERKGLYIPLSYEVFDIYQKLPQYFYSYCVYLNDLNVGAELASFDIMLMDTDGNILINIKNYTMIAVTDHMADRIWTDERAVHAVVLHELEEEDHKKSADQGAVGITAKQGKEIFKQLLFSDYPNPIVSKLNIKQRTEAMSAPEKHAVNTAFAKNNQKDNIRRSLLSVDYQEPVTETEKRLTSLYEEQLGTYPVGVTDDVFEYGIESLQAIHLSANIRKSFNIEIRLEDVFNNNTIRGLAAFIDGRHKADVITITPVAEKQFYKTSYAQKRMYFLHSLLKDSVSYNESTAFWIEGQVDANKIEATFMQVMKRQEILRTRFLKQEDEIVQVIEEQIPFALEYKEINYFDAEAEIVQFIRPFHLDQAGLFRVLLMKVESEKYILVLDIHHIIADGTSINLIIDDFAKTYMGNLPELLNIQYKDYAEWQNNFMESINYKRQQEYWKQELEGELPLLNLPCDFKRQTDINLRGGVVKYQLDKTLTNMLKDFSRNYGVTWFMTLLSVYYVLLGRLCKTEDILIGIPQSARRYKELESVVGMIINTLVLRNKPKTEMIFLEFLEETKKKLMGALENQDFQVEEILNELQFKREAGRSLLFDTIFNYQSMKNRTDEINLSLGDLRLRSYLFDVETTKADLNFHLYETEEGICFECFYRMDLFRKDTVFYLLSEYEKILRQVIINPQKRLSGYELFQQEGLIHQGNSRRPGCEYQPMSDKKEHGNIIARFEEMAFKYPEKTAVTYKDEVFCYRQLNQRANKIAGYILNISALSKERGTIALLFKNQPDVMWALLGALKTGIPIVPIDNITPIQRIAYMLEDADSRILITTSSELSAANKLRKSISQPLAVIIVEEVLENETCENVNIDIHPENPALILYTSGSTGRPKGVIQTHKNLYYYTAQLTKELNIHHGDALPLLTPYCHAIGMLDIFSTLLNGAALKLYDFKLDGNMFRFFNWLNKEKITIFHSVPSIFRFFMVNIDEQSILPHIRIIMLGGETVTSADYELYKKHCNDTCLFYNFLGCSELMVISFYITDKHTDFIQTTVPVGYLVDDINVTIIDKKSQPANVLEVGELYFSSEYISPGYLNNQKADLGSFIQDEKEIHNRIYKSGDYGRMLPDGCIEYYGRRDSQLKIRGHRVDLQEMETFIDGLPYMKKSVVQAMKNDTEYSIAVFYMPKSEASEDELKEALSEEFPYYFMPQYLIKVGKFPMTNTNKIDRNALIELVAEKNAAKNGMKPENECERTLADIWKEVLGLKEVHTEDGFFELGGHSLKLMKVQSEIEKRLDKNVDMADLFKYPTIKTLAAFLAGDQNNQKILNESRQRGERRKNLTGRRRN